MPSYPKLFNPSTPLGKSLVELSDAFLSGPSALERAKIKETQQRTSGIQNLSELVRTGASLNEQAAASVLADRMTEIDDLNRLLVSSQFGAGSPQADAAFVGAGGSFSGTGAGTREGFRSNESQNAARVAGSERNNARDNAGAFARNQYSIDNKPLNVIDPATGQPIVSTQAAAVGQTPVLGRQDILGVLTGQNFNNLGDLSLPQQSILGAAPNNSEAQGAITQGVTPQLSVEEQKRVAGATKSAGTPFNYATPDGRQGLTVDGLNDLNTGAPIPPGSQKITKGIQADNAGALGLTTASTSAFQKQLGSIDEASALAGDMRQIVTADPDVVGAVGNIRRGGQVAQSIGDALLRRFGTDGETFADIRAKFEGEAVNSKLSDSVFEQAFNTNLTDVEAVSNILAYALAAASGQSGRDVSDQDFHKFKQMVGDPTSWTSTPDAVLGRLNRIDSMLAARRKRVGGALESGKVSTAAPEGAVSAEEYFGVNR
jgi:hypothetical protein